MKDNNIQVHTRKALCGQPCTSLLPESSLFCTLFVAEEFNAGASNLFFYDKGPHRLLQADSRAARGKIAISGTPKH